MYSRQVDIVYTHTLRAWHQNVIVNRWTKPSGTLQAALTGPCRVSLTGFWCSIAHVHRGHHTHAHHMTYKWQMVISLWNIHCISETVNFLFFHLHNGRPPPLSGLSPIMPCALHLQTPPAYLCAPLSNHTAQTQLSLEGLRNFISCFSPRLS